ncbi:MAG: hypothetical protein GC159_19395 [Phycisphaera sp.]|nr:hypothetical protein [Phycisphaera sp.]
MTMNRFGVLLILTVLLGAAGPTLAAKGKHKHHRPGNAPDAKAPADPAPDASAAADRPSRPDRSFVVYEHIHNRGRPDDLTPFGLTPIELCYNTKTKQSVTASVTAKLKDYDGPIVFDIEKTNRNDHNLSSGHLKDVVKWAHEAVPGCKVGLYAVGPSNLTPMKRPVEKVVDAFYPSMYVHNTNRRAWANTARKLVTQGHRAHKPVYLFLMPKFHGRKGGEMPQSFWKYQLETARRVGADGVVIWSSDRDRWGEHAGWWEATKRFTKSLKPTAPKSAT